MTDATNKSTKSPRYESSSNNNNNNSINMTNNILSPLLTMLAYLLFGALHELSHLAVASWIMIPYSSSCSSLPTNTTESTSGNYDNESMAAKEVVTILMRALLGRYSIIEFPENEHSSYYFGNETSRWIIIHSGWIFSLTLAILCHFVHCTIVRNNNKFNNNKFNNSNKNDTMKQGSNSIDEPFSGIIMQWLERIFIEPKIVMAAYITAMEAVSTDLFGFLPVHPTYSYSKQQQEGLDDALICFCGNFGIVLLNSTWINIDGGRAALDVLEKMVNVTMMRGAQSGGVVTFEPTTYNNSSKQHHHDSSNATTQANNNNNKYSPPPPLLRGIRSRVVNAKRTDLSKRIRHKIERDNCTPMGNLRGWNKDEFNNNTKNNGGGGRLVRGFFGHTRFATSSKASFEGTHPHQWSKRRMYQVYSFNNASSSSSSASREDINTKIKRNIGVENYITHNGDFEFFKVNGKYYDVEIIQQWLEKVLGVSMPATVDSAAIAGVIDLLRTQGSFALSARFALCLELAGSKVDPDPAISYPIMQEYEEIAKTFENALEDLLLAGDNNNKSSLMDVGLDESQRSQLITTVTNALREKVDLLPAARPPALGESSRRHRGASSAMGTLSNFVSSNIEEGNLATFVQSTINAFFDNDLLHSTRLFLENAKGSFGLSVTSSLDAHRQVVFAARGQTMSIAFYPRKGLICFGSEQAAVKAGLNYENPGGNLGNTIVGNEADNAVRLDLDDLGGEICLLDWGYAGDNEPAVSLPNRNLPTEKLMNGDVNVVLLHQSKTWRECQLSKRLTLLENNEFVKPLLNYYDDPVLADIRDIPRVCAHIQDDWHDVGLNRMTAWNLANCIRSRMKAHVDGSIKCHGGQIDILVTGCEVSLWVAEQFVSDLQKCFPKLFIKAVSSNKLLGLFGQELSMPCTGFPFSNKSMDMKDPIIIIVSHSGGTFGPLACSNLLQSFSSSIFTVTSEWDTQIGKQLRSMYSDDLLSSRIFSTDVGVRPAEPCSVSVVATHQLLTNIFEHICVTIISDPQFRHVSGAVITERDLQILERCNQENLKALEEIVGVDREGFEIHERRSGTEQALRSAGDLWSEHILENAKAYIMSFMYIVGTVTAGYPLITGVTTAAGMKSDWAFYITRFLDSLIYFWLPQINIFILRMIQGRNIRHRMVGRTVVIGDCPWVAQSAEAFLSKIFACSYSIAGLNVLSGNPADHLVHRHTHRVVRGTLLVCGRPDGRLSALTSLEASTCLSVNQASSIQSLGGTCESITIGHNKSKLPLSHNAIYLKSHRPLFLCERVLDDIDAQEDLVRQRKEKIKEEKAQKKSQRISLSRAASSISTRRITGRSFLELSLSRSRQATQTRSSASLLGAYVNLEKDARKKRNQNESVLVAEHLSDVIDSMIKDHQGIENARRLFSEMDSDSNGLIGLEEFIEAYHKVDPKISREHLKKMFEEADMNEDGTLDFDEFLKVSKMPNLLAELSVKNRDSRGLVQVQASRERYFGEELRKCSPPGVNSMAMSQSQHFSMELYESRIASMQRFVSMTVMFHQMGMRVQTFFPKISFGLFGYQMDRTHSIMRIATTASPVSGADVRERMDELRLVLKIDKSVHLIARAWKRWKLEHKEMNS